MINTPGNTGDFDRPVTLDFNTKKEISNIQLIIYEHDNDEGSAWGWISRMDLVYAVDNNE